jgi:hypothetical protein
MRAAMGQSSAPLRPPPSALPLRWHDRPLAILRGPPDAATPAWLQGPLLALVRTPSETTLLCAESALPPTLDGAWRVRRGLCAVELAATLPMESLGVLAGLSACLSSAGVPLLCLSTFDTDWLFVDRSLRERAGRALAAAGYPLV